MLVRVFEMPTFSGGFRFGGGKPETFIEVDWFRDDPPISPEFAGPSFATTEGRAQIADFIRAKNYFRLGKSYLVLHPQHPFTVDYEAS